MDPGVRRDDGLENVGMNDVGVLATTLKTVTPAEAGAHAEYPT
jgi:hypothetical protein